MKKKFKMPFTTYGPPTIIEKIIGYTVIMIVFALAVFVSCFVIPNTGEPHKDGEWKYHAGSVPWGCYYYKEK
jgi:hypothetical protein